MSAVALRASGLSKQYWTGTDRHGALYRYIGEKFGLGKGNSIQEFWALRDVSFEVNRGEVLGVIGHNGAGKSTLLRILSRITEPTEGSAELVGRVASLLEVGTGFHPELTGRQNVYLNGAIHGLAGEQIRQRFDDIVEFAGVGRFIDTPVKRYSTGMYVRLAFGVAAFLDPDILLVDEVLAVGDSEFQRRCLGHLGGMVKSGRTVVFVSHNMPTVQYLCDRVIVLQHGRVAFSGLPKEATAWYMGESDNGNGEVGLHDGGVSVTLQCDESNGRNWHVLPGESLRILVRVEVSSPLDDCGIGIGFIVSGGERIATLHTRYQCNRAWKIASGATFAVEWLDVFLCPGTYHVAVGVVDGNRPVAYWPAAANLVVGEGDYFGTGRLPDVRYQGHVLARAEWTRLS